MKKMITILTLTLYFALSAVQIVSIHFCHGHLKSVAFSAPTENCCSGMPAGNSGCCENIVIEIDFDTDHIYSAELTVEETPIRDLFSRQLILYVAAANTQEVNNKYFNERPPPSEKFKLHSSFLFYG